MSDDDAVLRKFQMMSMTSNSCYSVRRSEEEMRALQKENFNLKLKIYFLENKYGLNTIEPTEVSNIVNKEFIDLYVENEALKSELEEKMNLMKKALEAIEQLELQKDEQIKESQTLIEELLKRIEALKVRSKLSKRKMSKKQVTFGDVQNPLKIQEEFNSIKHQNAELSACLESIKKENVYKSSLIEKLSSEKYDLLEKIDQMNRILNEKNNCIALQNEMLKEHTRDTNLTKVLEENKELRSKIEELSFKCSKLETECNDNQRIVNEQSEIIKALNRTIEVKNDELYDYKEKNLFESTSFIQDNEINLNENTDGTSARNFPFHNPLFGSIQSLYR